MLFLWLFLCMRVVVRLSRCWVCRLVVMWKMGVGSRCILL